VNHDLLQQVMRDLLNERISVRQLPLIIEASAEAGGSETSPAEVVEHVRRRLAFQFVSKLANEQGEIATVELAPAWSSKLQDTDTQPTAMEEMVQAIRQVLEQAAESGAVPVIAVTAPLRRLVKGALAARGVPNPVLAVEEIAGHARTRPVGVA